MRPGLETPQKPMRIRSRVDRNESGSVSPPAPLSANERKNKFFKNMRKKYENEALSSSELELKIEQLWNFFSASLKGLTIISDDSKSSGVSQKENTSVKAVIKKKTPERIANVSVIEQPKPVMDRNTNCKAIAKVLDLRSDNPSSSANSYKEVIKDKMRAYSTEASLVASRRLPVSLFSNNIPRRSFGLTPPPEEIKLESPENTADVEEHAISEEPYEIEIDRVFTPQSPPIVAEPSKLPSLAPTPKIDHRRVIEKSAAVAAPRISNLTVIPSKIRGQTVQRMYQVSKARPSFQAVIEENNISYMTACSIYYQILSQSDYLAPPSQHLIQPYANVMEGWKVAHEYTVFDRL